MKHETGERQSETMEKQTSNDNPVKEQGKEWKQLLQGFFGTKY